MGKTQILKFLLDEYNAEVCSKQNTTQVNHLSSWKNLFTFNKRNKKQQKKAPTFEGIDQVPESVVENLRINEDETVKLNKELIGIPTQDKITNIASTASVSQLKRENKKHIKTQSRQTLDMFKKMIQKSTNKDVYNKGSINQLKNRTYNNPKSDNVSSANPEALTPLHYAAVNGHFEIIKIFALYGYDLNVRVKCCCNITYLW